MGILFHSGLKDTPSPESIKNRLCLWMPQSLAFSWDCTYNFIPGLAAVNQVSKQNGILWARESASCHLPRTLLDFDALVVLIDCLRETHMCYLARERQQQSLNLSWFAQDLSLSHVSENKFQNILQIAKNGGPCIQGNIVRKLRNHVTFFYYTYQPNIL